MGHDKDFSNADKIDPFTSKKQPSSRLITSCTEREGRRRGREGEEEGVEGEERERRGRGSGREKQKHAS